MNELIDYEVTPSFNLTISSSDGNLSGEGQVTVNLNDIENDPLGLPKSKRVSVYPNPAAKFFTIDYSTTAFQSLSIFDYSGKMLKTFNKALREYDVSEMQSGTYIIIIDDNDGNKYSSRLIKQ